MRSSVLPPLTFAPLPVHRPWGGDRARALLDLPAPDAAKGPVGEWWLLSAREQTSTRVVGGPLDGATLADLMARDAVALLGACGVERHGHRFPLLLKLLDTAEPLSVQLHPSDHALPGEGKTESWYIVDARDDATFWLGLRDAATAAAVVEAARRGTSPESLLARHRAQGGLLAHLPPGTIHALGAGIVAVEFQSNADTTWRIWDWGRTPARPLHLDEAARDASTDQQPRLLQAAPDRSRSPPCDHLVRCDAYHVERMEVRAPTHLATDGDRCEILLSLTAPMRVRSEAGATVAPRGHALLLAPGTGDYVVTPDAPAELLRFLPSPVAARRSVP